MAQQNSMNHRHIETLQATIEAQKAEIARLQEQAKQSSHAIDDNIQMEHILLNMPGYIYWKNTKSQYMGCNKKLAKISNLQSPKDIIGKTDYDFEWGKYQAQQFIKDDQFVMETGKPLISEYELPFAHNHCVKKYVRTEKSPLYNSENEIIGILGVAIDLTESKFLEKQIIDNVPGSIYWKDKEGRYLGRNMYSMEKMQKTALDKSFDRDSVVGKTDYDFFPKEIADKYREHDLQVLQTGKEISIEEPVTLPDGSTIIQLSTKKPLYDNSGNSIGIIGNTIDITKQKIIEMEKELREANNIKTQFIRNMEHDIRTPFNGIWALTEILKIQEVDKQKKQYLSDISKSAKELLDYSNNILEFSKIKSGTLPIIEKNFSLERIVDSLISVSTPAAKIRNLKLEKCYDEHIPNTLIGDDYRLYRILLNLISNAIKFTDKGYVKLRATMLKKYKKFVDIQLIVEDTGIGIPKEKQEYIFEEFYRLTSSNQGIYKGIGLGLHLTKQFMHEIQGKINLTSQPGEGTQFMCTIPFKLNAEN